MKLGLCVVVTLTWVYICYGQGTPDTFLRLRDTPDTYAGQSLKGVRVNAAANALEFYTTGAGASTFLALTDTPSSYTGQTLKVVRVNAGETALEFVTLAGGGDALTSNPLSQFASTTSLQLKGVMSDETGSGALVFGTSPNITTPTGIVANDVGLGSVTNDAQTKAAIVPNTAPAAGQILVGNAGGTAYAKQTVSGSGATISLASTGVATLSAIPNATLSNSAITIAGTSTSLGGTITQDTITGLSSTGLVKRTAANTLTTITDNSANWDSAFTDRMKWDGGATGLVAATGRTSLALVIGTNVQAWDTDLDTWATITPGLGVGTFLATPSSANLRGALTDENGTGAALFNGATTPNFTTGFTIGGAAASGNIPIGNGTNYVPSTPTYPNASGAVGYNIRSDGTNFASYPTQIINSSVTSQASAFAADTYLTGSNVAVTAGDFKAKGQYTCMFDMVKTGAGTSAIVITLRIGTAGAIGDTARITWTLGAGTGVIDTGAFRVNVNWRTVGSGTTAVVSGILLAQHNLATTGLFSNAAAWTIVGTVSGGFDSSTATNIGLSFNGGTSFSGTTTTVQAQIQQ